MTTDFHTGDRVQLLVTAYDDFPVQIGEKGNVVRTFNSSAFGLGIDIAWDCGVRCSVWPRQGDLIGLLAPVVVAA